MNEMPIPGPLLGREIRLPLLICGLAAVVLSTALVVGASGASHSEPAGDADIPESAVLPSLIADRQTVIDSPISEKCFKCHGTDVAAREWTRSGHAHNLTVLRDSVNGRSSCLSCHSSGYRAARTQWSGFGAPPPATQPVTLANAINEVSCSSCHSHANEDDEAYLVRPARDLCISCHRMDCGCSGKVIIHQSQAEMFFGVAGKGVLSEPSAHAKEMNGNCATCHMYRPEGTADVERTTGGHTFKATMDGCKRCHDDGPMRIWNAREEILALLERVDAALERGPEAAPYPEAHQDATYNRDMVRGDGGVGLHNPTYAKALLGRSLRYLQVPVDDEEPSEAGE